MGRKPAVFFDRDGVLNVDTGYVYRWEDVVWIPGAIETIRYFNERGYLTFVVTNQSGIARGYYTEEDMRHLHERMNLELQSHGAHIDAFYFCPHHPDALLEEYRGECDCRKPQAGMIRKALTEWFVDTEASFLVGYKQSDIDAAKTAGISGYLFTGKNLYQFLKEKEKYAELPLTKPEKEKTKKT